MRKRKEKLLDRFVKKDYNNKLEEVLMTKDYSEDVKNFLLDIFYKVETAYNDYSKVKQNTLSKEEYIENLIETIKNKCDSIKFTKSKKEGKVEKKQIKCYPMPRKLLYMLAKLKKSEDIIKTESDLLNKTLTNLLNIGNNINTVEPFRDFNGFSWNVSTFEIENLYYNLIYQDLIILVGDKFLEEWTNKNECIIEYMELFKSELANVYGKKNEVTMILLLKKISVLLELNRENSLKDIMIKKAENIKKTLEEMEDGENYIVKLGDKKKKLIRKIKSIDIIINNKELLKEKYKVQNEKLPLEKKIFSARIYAKKLSKDREQYLKKLEEINNLMNPKNFRKRKEELLFEYELANLANIENNSNILLENIILLQKEVYRAIRIKIKNSEKAQDLKKIIYEMRYFNLLPVIDEKKITDFSELSRVKTLTIKEFLFKAYELKLINQVFKNKEIDVNIFKYILDLRIISLEDVYFKIYKENEYFIQFYDENVIDEKFKTNVNSKEELNIKLNKKIKLFNN